MPRIRCKLSTLSTVPGPVAVLFSSYVSGSGSDSIPQMPTANIFEKFCLIKRRSGLNIGVCFDMRSALSVSGRTVGLGRNQVLRGQMEKVINSYRNPIV